MTTVEEEAPEKAGIKPLWRLVVVVMVALLAFAGALIHFRAAPAGACVATATHDASYQAQFLEPLTLNSNVYHVAVTHDGQPVTGARVCVGTFMVGMSGMGSSRSASKEVSTGHYEFFINFQMAGPFVANVGVSEPGKPPVVVPLRVTVNP